MKYCVMCRSEGGKREGGLSSADDERRRQRRLSSDFLYKEIVDDCVLRCVKNTSATSYKVLRYNNPSFFTIHGDLALTPIAKTHE